MNALSWICSLILVSTVGCRNLAEYGSPTPETAAIGDASGADARTLDGPSDAPAADLGTIDAEPTDIAGDRGTRFDTRAADGVSDLDQVKDLSGGNLITNPGCEDPGTVGDIPGWQEIHGKNWQCRAEITPQAGRFHFYPAVTKSTIQPKGSIGELWQEIDVSALVSAAASTFVFRGYVGNYSVHSTDESRIVIEYLAADKRLLDSYDSGKYSRFGGWRALDDKHRAPAGTHWVRIRLISTHYYTGTNDGYYDSLHLGAR